MLTKDEIEAKLKANPDWEPDSASPPEVWDLYYEVLNSVDFDGSVNGEDSLEEPEEDEEDVEDGWDEDTF